MRFPLPTARPTAIAIALLLAVAIPPSGAAADPGAAAADPAATAPDTGTDAAAARTGGAAAAPAATQDDSWIAPDDIAERADSLSRQVDAAMADTTTDELIGRLSKSINDSGDALDSACNDAKAAIRDRATLMAIQDARQQVEAAGSDFPAWQQELGDEGRRLAALAARMDNARQLWARTRARPEVQSAGEIVLRRIDHSLADLDQALSRIHDLRTRLLALDDRIVDHDTVIRGTVHNLEEATRDRGSNLAIPDRDPLWHRGLGDALAAELPKVPGALAEFQRSTVVYFRADSRPFFLQAALMALLMVLFHRMRGSLGQVTFPEGTSQATVRLLTRPYAMAMLLALIPSPALHPTAPRRVTQLIGMLALFPVARILSLLQDRVAWSLYGGLLLLLLLDRLSMSLTALPTVNLLLFLVEILLGWWLAAAYRRQLRADGDSPWLVRALSVGIAGLVLSLLAEVGGWSALAAMVGRLVLVSGLTGLLIGAATLSLEALLAYALASPAMRSSHFVNANQDLVHRWSSIVVRVIGVAYWLRLIMTALGLRAQAGELAASVLDASITVGALSISLGGTLAFVLTIGASMVFSRIVRELLEDEIFPRMNLPRGIPHALLTLVNYTVWALGFLLALGAAGVQMSQLAILLGGFGVGIGLGLQDVVKNFAAGITLLLERRVHVGDTVEIPDKKVFGRVLAVGMRASVVRNWNGSEVVMPNNDLVDGTVTNWTLSDPSHRIDVPVQVACDNDPEAVMALLVSVAAADPALLRKPAPTAQFTGFGPNSLDFVLKAWTGEEYEKTGGHTSRLTLAVYRALHEGGIRLPDGSSTVNLVPMPPAAKTHPLEAAAFPTSAAPQSPTMETKP